jgi:flagellar hook-length control protein FliK
MTTDLFVTPTLPQKPPSPFSGDRAGSFSSDPSSKTEPPGLFKGPKHENFLTTLNKVSRDRNPSEGSQHQASHAVARADKIDRHPKNEQKIDPESADEDALIDKGSLPGNDGVSRNDQTSVAVELKELVALLENLGLNGSSAELIGEIQSSELKPGNDISTVLERLLQFIASALAAGTSGDSPSNPKDGHNLNQTPGFVDFVNRLKEITQGQENAGRTSNAMAAEGAGGEKPAEIIASMIRAVMQSENVSQEPGPVKAVENSQIPTLPENPEKSHTASETARDIKFLEKVPGNVPVTDDEPEMAGKAGNSNRNTHFSQSPASADAGRHPGVEPLQENSLAGDSSPVSKSINDAQVEKENFLKVNTALGDDAGSKVVKTEAGTNDGGQLTSQTQTFLKAIEAEFSAKGTEAVQRELRTQTMEQIVQRAVIQARNGQHEARIDLKPDFLGHVRMQVITENQQVTVKILTEFGFVKDMIENNISQLKADLQQQGLGVDRIDVSVSRDGNGNNHQQENTEHARDRHHKDKSSERWNGREGHREQPHRSALSSEGLATVDYFA